MPLPFMVYSLPNGKEEAFTLEFKYSVSKQDYIDFNLNYFNNNAVVQRSIWMMRVATAVIVIIGGSVLMYWLHALTLVSGLVYLALAAVCFF